MVPYINDNSSHLVYQGEYWVKPQQRSILLAKKGGCTLETAIVVS